jgi:rRNA maturation endonuclease Nob1
MYIRRGVSNIDWTKAKPTVANIAAYVAAEASLVMSGPVAPEVFEARKAACMGCEHRATNTEPPDEIGFCKSCGCGTSARARLSVKLTMPAATCPQKKW